jgi:isopentenyl diphosphate isomerase/L-lactate dehydrogenase-like FMN-dependent dehydrogenase
MEKKPGDANRITREYFDSMLIEMRHIDAVLPDTSFTLFGETFATPIMTAALSHLDHFGYHKDGMVELAKGAKAANAVMWAGMGSERELERIVETGAKTIKIVKPEADNEVCIKKLKHAESLGCMAVGMDLDHAFNWKGEYDEIEKMPMRPKSFEELKMLVNATKLPFIVKGVLSVQDTKKCMEAGVQGIVVSHHHGIMEYAVPTLMVLPKIVKTAGGKLQIFVDCGIESGYDTFKAIALGAQAVSAGRSLLGPLKEKGGEGVAEKIKEMTTQLAAAMARTACANILNIDPSLICKEPRYFS